MLLLLPLVLSLCVGWTRGGSLRNLAASPLRLPWLPLLAILTQLSIFEPFSRFAPVRLPVVPLHVLSYVLLAAFVWVNRALPGMWLVGLGLLANAAAIVANGGFMPASEEALRAAGRWTRIRQEAGVYNNSSLIRPGTPLWFLGDVFAIPAGVPFANVFSIGDVLLALGVLVLVPSLMGARPLRPEHRLAAGVTAGFLIGYLAGSVHPPNPRVTQLGASQLSPAPAVLPSRRIPPSPRPESPVPPPTPASKVWYVVQVGAFRERANAHALVERLERDGYDGRVVSGSLHRVFVGEFETESEARRLRELLVRSGYRAFVRAVNAPGSPRGR